MKEDILKFIKYQLTEHCGRTVGMILGFIIPVLMLIIGFWATLFIVVCMGIGLYLGTIFDDHDDKRLEEWVYKLQRLLPPYSRR